jgi:hypothetical protein
VTVPQAALEHRATRLVWWWCVAYSSLTPAGPRRRRRGEIRSHLWESEAAGLHPRRVAFAAVRGAHADLAWAVIVGFGALVRSFATPTPYVVLAAIFPVQAWLGSSMSGHKSAQWFEASGLVGGLAMLCLALAAWFATRHRP